MVPHDVNFLIHRGRNFVCRLCSTRRHTSMWHLTCWSSGSWTNLMVMTRTIFTLKLVWIIRKHNSTLWGWKTLAYDTSALMMWLDCVRATGRGRFGLQHGAQLQDADVLHPRCNAARYLPAAPGVQPRGGRRAAEWGSRPTWGARNNATVRLMGQDGHVAARFLCEFIITSCNRFCEYDMTLLHGGGMHWKDGMLIRRLCWSGLRTSALRNRYNPTPT